MFVIWIFLFKYFYKYQISILNNDYAVFYCHSNVCVNHSKAFMECQPRLWEFFRSQTDHIPAEGARWQSNSEKLDSSGLIWMYSIILQRESPFLMCGRWVEIHVFTFKAFFQGTKSGLTQAIWNCVHPSRKQRQSNMKCWEGFASRCLRQNKVSVPESSSLRQDVNVVKIEYHE